MNNGATRRLARRLAAIAEGKNILFSWGESSGFMASSGRALTLRIKNGQVPFIQAFLFPDGVMNMKHEFPSASEKEPKQPEKPVPPVKQPVPGAAERASQFPEIPGFEKVRTLKACVASRGRRDWPGAA